MHASFLAYSKLSSKSLSGPLIYSNFPLKYNDEVVLTLSSLP